MSERIPNMPESLEKETTSELASRSTDYVATAAKLALSEVPFVGSLLAELAGNIIPNQRIDRIVKFAKALEKRLNHLEKEFVRSAIGDENFNDLLEEGFRQAAQSLSDERRDYIASLLVNSLSSEDIQYAESKHLLRILGELNDVEVLWLRFHLIPTINGDLEFREKHTDIFKSVDGYLGGPTELVDKAALQRSYKEHLAQLNLLDRQYEMKTSNFGTTLKCKRYNLTRLGNLLLKEIDLDDSHES